MEKRVLLAVGLSVAVLIGFNILFPPVKRPTPAATSAPGAAAGTPPAASATAPAATEVERSVAPASAAPPAPAAQTLVGDTAERQIVVENEAVRATFSTRGGVLTSWLLKHYAENGAPLELVPASAPPGSTKPFTLITDDAGRECRARAGAVQTQRSIARCEGRPRHADAGVPRRQRPVGAQGVLLLAAETVRSHALDRREPRRHGAGANDCVGTGTRLPAASRAG